MRLEVRPHRLVIAIANGNQKVEGWHVTNELQRPQERIATEYRCDVIEMTDVIDARNESLLSGAGPQRVHHHDDIHVAKPLLDSGNRQVDLARQQVAER